MAAFAAPKTYTIVAGERQVATVDSKTALEAMTGKTSRVSGSIQFDARARRGGGTITVDVASIDTGIPLRNDHMRSEQWLNASKHPTITFRAVRTVFRQGNVYDVTGDFTLHGVTRRITVPVEVRAVAASDQTRRLGFQGDVLNVKTTFKIKLSDHNIKISKPAEGKISNEVTISLNVLGSTGR